MNELLGLIVFGFYIYWVYWCVKALVLMSPTISTPNKFVMYLFFSIVNPLFTSIYIYFRYYHTRDQLK
jgi:hypothetical protein